MSYLDWGFWATLALTLSLGAMAGFVLASVLFVGRDSDRWSESATAKPAPVDGTRLAELEAALVKADERANFYESLYCALVVEVSSREAQP